MEASAGRAVKGIPKSVAAIESTVARLARPRRGDACPLGICDGSGFTYDLETNTAYDCRCRPQRVALAKARSLSAVIPRRYRDVSFDRPPVTDIDVTIVAATRRFSETIDDQLDAGRGLWFMGPVGISGCRTIRGL